MGAIPDVGATVQHVRSGRAEGGRLMAAPFVRKLGGAKPPGSAVIVIRRKQ
jgi:hypothetical protein